MISINKKSGLRSRYLATFLISAASVFLSIVGVVSAQQASRNRLMAFSVDGAFTNAFGQLAPLGFTLFEVDPGSGLGQEIPITPAPGTSAFFGGGTWAFDPSSAHLYVYGPSSPTGGTLLKIDVHTGVTINTFQVPEVRQLQFETSTGRLLGLIWAAGVGYQLANVDTASGIVSAIGPPLPLPLLYVPVGGAGSAIDPVQNRYFVAYSVPQHLAVIDTLTGNLIIDNVTPGQECNHWVYDSSRSTLYAFKFLGVYPPGVMGVVTVDPMTGLGSPLPVGHPTIWSLAPSTSGVVIDEQRGTYHYLGAYGTDIATSTHRLFTFDLTTGEILSDPVLTNANTTPYLYLAVDVTGTPARGRVSFAPNNVLVPGTTRSVTFEAFGHGGEVSIPFVSCTPGNLQVPGSNLQIPLAFDTCSTFYFGDPAASVFFNLTSTGALVDVLPPGALFQGSVSLPMGTPPGLGFDVYITFLTINSSVQWTGVHGMGILHVSS